MKRGMRIGLMAIIIVSLVLSLGWLIRGNLMFHSDIARDFWLMKDIVDNRHLTLIGPRAGGIEGFFHGPLWFYLNLPFYVVGGGNPVVVAWGWWILHLLTLFLVFWTSKKIFGKEVAWWATAVLASVTILSVHNYINPQGAVIVAPLWFYFYWKYKRKRQTKDLVVSLFLVGLMIQFEVAFGGIILALTFFDNLRETIRDRKFKRWWAYLILTIPLSTYFLFEIRHSFLQMGSIWKYIEEGSGGGAIYIVYGKLIWERFWDLVWSFDILTKNKILTICFWVMILFLIKKEKKNEAFNLWKYFYFGFWILSLVFKGKIQSYYYMAFLPITAVVFSGLVVKNKTILGKLVLVLIIILGLFEGIKDGKDYKVEAMKQNESTWQTNKAAAQWVMDRAKGEFGYYIYTPDLYGYGPAYALDFLDKNSLGKRNEKMKQTFLIMSPNVKENSNGRENWKRGEVRIERKADEEIEFENGIRVEEFNLNDEEVKIEGNQFLIKDNFFR